MQETANKLTFEDLTPYLLLKNGNFLYKVPFGDDWAVLKIYYGSRGTLGRLRKSLANVLYSGQTSYMPKTRCRIERECLALWRSHGFRVFDNYEDVTVDAPGCVPGGYLLLECVEAPKLLDILQDEQQPLEDRFALYRKFLQEWSHRHDLAISEREPRLVHENGDLGHVMILDEGFLWFDFEMVYRYPSNVREYVNHEIVQYIWDTHKNIPLDIRDRFLDETVRHYPDRSRLAGVYDHFYNHPNPILRGARSFDRRYRKRARKPTSKYNVVLKLREKLKNSSSGNGAS